MADESPVDDPRAAFSHDADHFDPGSPPSGVELSADEAKYAELFSEAMWHGVITVEKRAELESVAALYEIPAARVARLEEALRAAYEARHHTRIIDESSNDTIEP